jgi:hypothetical protein
MDVSFTIAAGPRQRSHSQVRVSRDPWPHFTVSDSRLPQPGGPGPSIYIPQEQSGPVIPSGTGFPFLRFLRLAGLRWRYSTPPPRGIRHCLSLIPQFHVIWTATDLIIHREYGFTWRCVIQIKVKRLFHRDIGGLFSQLMWLIFYRIFESRLYECSVLSLRIVLYEDAEVDGTRSECLSRVIKFRQIDGLSWNFIWSLK